MTANNITAFDPKRLAQCSRQGNLPVSGYHQYFTHSDLPRNSMLMPGHWHAFENVEDM